jgi:hypothetical protein
MKKQLLFAAATCMAFGFSTAALATDNSETGTITLTGNVPAQCTIVSGGQGSGTSFTDTISLNESNNSIADGNGHLWSDLSGATATSAATKTYRVNCTGAGNNISVTATALQTGDGTAPANYAAKVDFIAAADFSVISSSSVVSTVSQAYATKTSSTTGSTSFGAGARLNNSGTSNITVRAYQFNTNSTTNDILVAGPYTGQIVLTVGVGA